MESRSRRRLFAAAALAALTPSCGTAPDGQMAVHPVQGEVRFQGKPLAEALVVFHPVDAAKDDGRPRPTGQTGADGKFQLHTYLGNDGAPAGEYRVAISIAPRPAEGRDLMANAVNKAVVSAPVDPIQYRYYDPEKSGLSAKVSAGDNVLAPFDLK